jgi:hypothetical protein
MRATQDILNEALTEAVGTMAFLSTGPVDDQMVGPDSPVLTEMRFRGPKSGTLQLFSGLALGRVLAVNIGSLAEADDQAALDAWREVCNVTCGLVIPRIAASEEEVYDVTVPSVRTGGQAPGWGPFISQDGSHVVNVEGFAAAVRLAIDS